jgi:class 3 adenylate cyclase
MQDKEYQLRIGIHMGEVVSSGHDIIGDGVNIAARIQALAEPGASVVSDIIYQNIKNKLEFKASLLGEKKLKNVESDIKLYQLNTKDNSGSTRDD